MKIILNNSDLDGFKTQKTQEHRTSLLYDVFKKRLHELILRYSMGDEVEYLKPHYEPIIAAWEEYLGDEYSRRFNFSPAQENLEDYVVALWLISLAIIFRVDGTLFGRMVACVGNPGRDLLIERLIGTRIDGRPAATSLAFPIVYDTLYSTIDNVERRNQLMKAFLKKWYSDLLLGHTQNQGLLFGLLGY